VEETLGEGEVRTRKHAIEGEVCVVMAGGCSSSFYSGRGGTLGRGRGKRPTVMALTPLMAGRLDEGLRRGIKAWSEYLTEHLEVGPRGRKTKLTARPHLAER
jgi:hypothetical protein